MAGTDLTLDELLWKTVADRMELAGQLARRARIMLDTDARLSRDALSRGYYAMYHCWRALAFFSHGGDDYEDHTKLPSFEPPGFPNLVVWQNRLTDARLLRNQADYDAFPKASSAWLQDAQRVASEAEELVKLGRRYLRQRGMDV